MAYRKLNIILSGLCLAIWLPIAVVFLFMNTLLGYGLSTIFFGFSFYTFYYLYRKLRLHKSGQNLSEEKKRKKEQYRKQMHNYQRYNLDNRLYRFADATELEYQTEKAKEQLKHSRK